VSIAATAGGVRRRRFLTVLGGITAVNVLINLSALVTGPLQARLLGPQGRGELALIMVVTGFAPIVVSLGMSSFLAREITRTARRGVLLGTVAALSLALGVFGALWAYPVSRLFGDGHQEVQTLILVGLLVLPISVIGANLHGAYWGLEQWRRFNAMRSLPVLLTAIAYVALALLGAFTVVSAALAAFTAAMLGLLVLVPLLRTTVGWGFDRDVARRAIGFGAKANAATLASQGTVRIDQLFVATLAGTRQLGFYVVAATLAGATLIVSQALNYMVVPMVATGDHRAVRRILRITLALMTLAAIAIAGAAGPLVELVFGDRYEASVDVARILCAGAVFVAGKGIVSAALVGRGRPGEPAIVEVATFAALIPALLLVVPAAGVTGAAAVVTLAAGAGFAALVVRARRWLGGGLVEYLLPTSADAGWLIAAARRRT
jgi:O-antigen/teichoic acid export membrane protein